jgi:hypothetical protein
MGKIRVNVEEDSCTPFKRYVGDISLNHFIVILTKARDEYEKRGYSNLELVINKDCGCINMYIYGERDLNESEIKERDELAVILRMKPLSNEGLTRDEIFERNS